LLNSKSVSKSIGLVKAQFSKWKDHMIVLRNIRRRGLQGLVYVVLASATGCTTVGNLMNPFYEPPSEIALQGSATDHALLDTGKTDTARQALEAMATYQRANAPQPGNPVMQPAVVRLMWIPDHLNDKGDLVPSHYYYLKVLSDRWAVSDAFELEGQLGASTGTSNVPFIRADDVKR
jgi:hypothetical protein